MTERLEDVRRTRAVIDEIGEVVSALRAIAAARSTEAQSAMTAISAYQANVSSAFARLALALPGGNVEGPGLVLVVGAAQGFCGGYPAHVADTVLQQAPKGAGLLVIGQRSLSMLEEAGVAPLFRADLPAAPRFVPALASEVTDALLKLGENRPGPILSISGADLPGLPIQTRQIWPPNPAPSDAKAQPAILTGTPPLTTLPSGTLLQGLLSETLFASVALTIMQGLRVENRARVEAMARAQSNLKTRRAEVDLRYRQARQEQMTTEVIELSMGSET